MSWGKEQLEKATLGLLERREEGLDVHLEKPKWLKKLRRIGRSNQSILWLAYILTSYQSIMKKR